MSIGLDLVLDKVKKGGEGDDSGGERKITLQLLLVYKTNNKENQTLSLMVVKSLYSPVHKRLHTNIR